MFDIQKLTSTYKLSSELDLYFEWDDEKNNLLKSDSTRQNISFESVVIALTKEENLLDYIDSPTHS